MVGRGGMRHHFEVVKSKARRVCFESLFKMVFVAGLQTQGSMLVRSRWAVFTSG